MAIAVGKLKLDKYDEKRKAYFDRKRKNVKFVVGDLVLVYKGPKRQGRGVRGKLRARWSGPYRIVSVRNHGYNFTVEEPGSGVRFKTNIRKVRKYYERTQSTNQQQSAQDRDRDRDRDRRSDDSMGGRRSDEDSDLGPSRVDPNRNRNVPQDRNSDGSGSGGGRGSGDQ